MLTLGASWLVSVLALLFILTCLFMMLVILIQKPKGGGLSGAFGGAGGSAQAAFGAKTGDLLTTITIGCFVAFLGLSIALIYAIRADVSPRGVSTPTPEAVPTETAPADTTSSTSGTPENVTVTTEAPATTTDQPASDGPQ